MLGIISFLLNIIGHAEYAAGVYKGKYHPARVSWVLWTLVLSLTFMSYRSVGAGASLWFIAGDLVMTGIIACGALLHGKSGYTKLDICMVVTAGIGLLAWVLVGQPITALCGALLADLCGVVPTIKNSLDNPMSESYRPYTAGAVASLIGLLLVGQWNLNLLVYPAYLFVANGVVAVIVVVGQYHVRRGILPAKQSQLYLRAHGTLPLRKVVI